MQFQAEFLPPQVRELVCYNPSLETAAADNPGTELQPSIKFIDNHGLLVVDSIQQYLPQGVMENSVPAIIESCDLLPFKRSCVLVQAELKQLSFDSLQTIYADQMCWMGATGKRASEIWLDLYANGQFNQAWLIGSTILEQLIGNIIYTLQGPEKFIPFLVRDLLSVPCLTRCINRTLIRALKTMIGSPLTLNIRNLLWHGFITPGDDIPLDAYGAMLIAVTMTIADGAKAKLNTPLTIRHLNPKSFYGQLPQQNQSSVPAGDLDSIFEALAYGPTLSLVDSQEVSEILHYLVSKSTFVTPGTAEQWIAACHHLNPDSGSSFVFIMSTLPLVEHALRLVYVAVNQCKLDRRSALIAGEYYLTLDVILDKVVPAEYYESDSAVLLDNEDHENIPNRLYSELGVPAMNLINDLFILGLGPRLRDRTSHGELNSYLTLDVTKETWFGYYAGLTIYLLHKYSSEISESISERIMRYISWKDQYFECRFDERSILKRETAHCQMLLAEYVDFVVGSRADVVRADNDSDVLNPEVGVEIILSLDGATVFSNKDSVSGHIPLESRLQSSLFSWSIVPSMSPTASMFSSNLPAWILIVQSIQGAIEKVTLKVRTLSEQLSLRQLSSRARKQFENMKPLIPRLLGMLIGCLAVVEHFVLTPPQRTPALSLLDGSSAEGGERLEAKLEGLSISASGKTSPSTLGLGNNSSGGATDKSSADEIMLRLKISTFIDKFVSNFDRVKLSSIEPAWEELAKCIEALPESRAR